MARIRPFLIGFSILLLFLVRTKGQGPQTPKETLRSFDRVLLLEEKGEDSAGVDIGDLNGDGLLDIVLGKGRHGPLFNRVLLNNGKGGFTATNLGTAPDRTYSAALADLDRDGDLDIVVSNDSPDRKLVYLNDGKGRFTEAGTFGSPAWETRYVTLADLNGDRYPDIVAANRGDGPQSPRPASSASMMAKRASPHANRCPPNRRHPSSLRISTETVHSICLCRIATAVRASCCGTMARAISRHRRKWDRRRSGSAWEPLEISMEMAGSIWQLSTNGSRRLS
jgi:hypothetical protein